MGGDEMNEIEPLNYYNGDKKLYLAKTIHRVHDYIECFKPPKGRCITILKAYMLMARGWRR